MHISLHQTVHRALHRAVHRLRQVPEDFHTHPLHLSAPQSLLCPEPVASSFSASWADLVIHPDEDVVFFAPNWVPSCSNRPQRLVHRRRQGLATHSASNHLLRFSLSCLVSFSSSAPLCPLPRLALSDHNRPRLLQGLPRHQPQADQPGGVHPRQLALVQRKSAVPNSSHQPTPEGDGTPADGLFVIQHVQYTLCILHYSFHMTSSLHRMIFLAGSRYFGIRA